VVDTYGSYAFGFLHVSKQPEAAVAVLHNDGLPFYRDLELPIRAVLTDNGREFCGTEQHPLTNSIWRSTTSSTAASASARPGRMGSWNASTARCSTEFFRVKMRDRFDDGVDVLSQEGLRGQLR